MGAKLRNNGIREVTNSFVCGRFRFALDRPLVMGIVNVTPDSFSDGGRYADTQRAIEHGLRLREEGADILDIGGESTRPGATPVEADEELRRILPVLEGLRNCGAALSIDTMKTQVMAVTLGVGADMINDVNALCAPGALETVAISNCGVCLMHMSGTPETMQQAPRYDNVVSEVLEFLKARSDAAIKAGISRERLVWDPGFGFGKTPDHNLELFRGLSTFSQSCPTLVGLSRKSLFGVATGQFEFDRLVASVTGATLAILKGVKIMRVHDVAATRVAIKIVQKLDE